MFKGKVDLYKNVDGREEEVIRDFDNEEEFNEFIERNLELRSCCSFRWESIQWSALGNFRNFFRDKKEGGGKNFLKELETDFGKIGKKMNSLFSQSKKLPKK